MKICATCKVSKDISQFGVDKSNKDGHSYHCKKCRSEKEARWRKENPEGQKKRSDKYRVKRKEYYISPEHKLKYRKWYIEKKFNISYLEYEKLQEEQENKCAICKQEERSKRNSYLSVDHDHTTGKIRGLLCNDCNRGIGLLKDDPVLLEKAINYLKINNL